MPSFLIPLVGPSLKAPCTQQAFDYFSHTLDILGVLQEPREIQQWILQCEKHAGNPCSPKVGQRDDIEYPPAASSVLKIADSRPDALYKRLRKGMYMSR